MKKSMLLVVISLICGQVALADYYNYSPQSVVVQPMPPSKYALDTSYYSVSQAAVNQNVGFANEMSQQALWWMNIARQRQAMQRYNQNNSLQPQENQ